MGTMSAACLCPAPLPLLALCVRGSVPFIRRSETWLGVCSQRDALLAPAAAAAAAAAARRRNSRAQYAHTQISISISISIFSDVIARLLEEALLLRCFPCNALGRYPPGKPRQNANVLFASSISRDNSERVRKRGSAPIHPPTHTLSRCAAGHCNLASLTHTPTLP